MYIFKVIVFLCLMMSQSLGDIIFKDDLQNIIDQAFEQHRISRFFTIRPKNVEFKRATLLK